MDDKIIETDIQETDFEENEIEEIVNGIEQNTTVVDDSNQANISEQKNRNIFVTILAIFSFLLLLFVTFETVIAFLNFNLIRNEKEPKYFVTKLEEENKNIEYTIYDMGLYKIVRKDTVKNFEIRLLPFFMDYKK